jgi:CRP/FNR family transcriptional regulator
MNRHIKGSICTDIEWIGRAHCEKCHVRYLMFFSDLPNTAFENLLSPIDHMLYPAGSTIYEIDSHKQFTYSIRRGMVKLIHIESDGEYRIVRLLGPGTVIGLELLDGAKSYLHTAVAITDVDLCRIPVNTVQQLESEYPALCTRVSDQLQEQLNLADQWIIALSAGSAKHRVARLLLMLNQFYADKDGIFILLSREDMAAMIGIATETVSRMIAEFKRLDILKKTSKKHYTCDVAALNEIIKNE